MTLPAAVIMGLAAQCAPDVAPATIAAIVQTESRGFELAIGVNGLARQPAPATSVAQAVQTARSYVDKGYSVDLGLGQINSRNMKALGMTWDNVFDPCTNIAAAGAVLSGNYRSVRAGLHPSARCASPSPCTTPGRSRVASPTAMSERSSATPASPTASSPRGPRERVHRRTGYRRKFERGCAARRAGRRKHVRCGAATSCAIPTAAIVGRVREGGI
ncbi:lytic transglycosylase domain-containing protein [Sphingomonas sp. NIC1]|uniref:lytic transglycosylase domain-containing protein n=1 Tax=Sphingomonas sp. NIC1 TaxID=1961362 RepID=UPI001CF6ED78|nr:lytic transglycosylase domain-containing protein [Sphingomonas sp. NIC1]